MTRQFQHAWSVTIKRNTRTPTEERFFLPLPDILKITEHRIKFEIERSLERSPNTCMMQIFNLSPATRDELRNENIVVQLAAGYDNAPRPLFVGDVTFARSNQEGTEWVTDLQLGDGARAFAHARRNKSYAGGTKVITVLREAASSMGLSLPDNVLKDKALQQEFSAGYVASGRVRDELTRLLAPYGYGWSFQDGRLQLLRDEDSLGAPRLISEATGLQGSPDFDKPSPRRGKHSKKYRGPKATLRVQLYPEITPGSRVEVDCRALQGVFKVYRVKHAGDSHGDDWRTEIEIRV